jgi:hypothetical protein
MGLYTVQEENYREKPGRGRILLESGSENPIVATTGKTLVDRVEKNDEKIEDFSRLPPTGFSRQNHLLTMH